MQSNNRISVVSGMLKFIPYHPAISVNGMKIVVTIVRICITLFCLTLILARYNSINNLRCIFGHALCFEIQSAKTICNHLHVGQIDFVKIIDSAFSNIRDKFRQLFCRISSDAAVLFLILKIYSSKIVWKFQNVVRHVVFAAKIKFAFAVIEKKSHHDKSNDKYSSKTPVPDYGSFYILRFDAISQNKKP